MTIRIMLVDDHRLLRETLAVPLANEPGFAVVAQAGCGREALELLDDVRPDLLLLDIGLPDMSGVKVAHQALKRRPDLRIIALSGYADKIFVDEMLKAGARAYVLKSAGTQELILAMRAVLDGHVFLSPEITAIMLERGSPSPSQRAVSRDIPLDILGRRELHVLRLLAQGAPLLTDRRTDGDSIGHGGCAPSQQQTETESAHHCRTNPICHSPGLDFRLRTT